jgi:hypothetical protein
MKFVIDQMPIPIPDKQRKQSAYPWDQLEIGGSFFVGLGPAEVRKADTNRMMNAMRYQNAKKGKKYEMRVMGDVVRVWRVA